MTPRGHVARMLGFEPRSVQLDHMLFAQSHGVAGEGWPVLALGRSLSSLLGAKQSMPRKWLQLAAGRLKCGMSKWPIEKIIQEAGLKGKDPCRGVCGEPLPESPLSLSCLTLSPVQPNSKWQIYSF